VAAATTADVLFCSGWRQQQMLTCCFVQVSEFVTSNPNEKIGYKNITFFSLFCAYDSTGNKNILFLYTK